MVCQYPVLYVRQWNVLSQLAVFFIAYGFAPFVAGVLTRNFYCDMAEPAVLSRSMPVLHLAWDRDDITGVKFHCFLSLFLIPSPP